MRALEEEHAHLGMEGRSALATVTGAACPDQDPTAEVDGAGYGRDGEDSHDDAGQGAEGCDDVDEGVHWGRRGW